MPSSQLPRRSARPPTEEWARRAPGLRVAAAALLLAVVALGVAWAGTSLAPVGAEPAFNASPGGGGH